MSVIHKIERWGDNHHPRLLDIIRIVLGVFLLLKGIAFMQNTSDLKYLIENQSDIILPSGLLISVVYFAAFVHMVGGVLVALGLYTRTASLMQIPIVFGAVFFINILLSPFNTELWASILCLVLLVIFAVIGSGKLSLDNFIEHLDN
ncbi:MAG TPA: DoxX family protein [Mucilaginibacter sp.]|nr:DoxX family protein [Mucilaginibacter sp.]